MYVCMYVCMYVYIYIYIYTYIRIYTYIYIHIRVCIYIYIYIYSKALLIYVHMYVCIIIYTYIYTYIHTYIIRLYYGSIKAPPVSPRTSAFSISALAASPLSMDRQAMTTVAPCAYSAAAVPRPMPVLAPVTRTI